MFSKKIILIVFILILSSCVSPRPTENYVLANEALRSARESGALTYSPIKLLEAEKKYHKAQKLLIKNANKEAEEIFIQSRKLSEEAEMISRVKKSNSGDHGP